MAKKSDRNRTGIGVKRKRKELKKAYDLGRRDAARIRGPQLRLSEQDVRDALVKSCGVLAGIRIRGRTVVIGHYLHKYELHDFARELRRQNPTERPGRPLKFTTEDVREMLVKCNGSYREAERLGIAKAVTLIQRARKHGLVSFARDLREANPHRKVGVYGPPVHDDIDPKTALDAFMSLRTVSKVAKALDCSRPKVLRLLGDALASELEEKGVDLNTWLRQETRWNTEAESKKEGRWQSAISSLRRKAERKLK